MSWDNYLNMEVLALSIADEHIQKMTENNKDAKSEEFIDEEMLINNMKNGFVVAVMLSNYIESFLNTILRDCIDYRNERLLKSNLEDKLEIIYLYYGVDNSKLKSRNEWAVYKKITKLRNELIHYKFNYLGGGSGIPSQWNNLVNGVVDMFTRDSMMDAKTQIVELTKVIVGDLGLAINEEAGILDCEARDGCYTYVFNPNNTSYDEDRKVYIKEK